jgi:5-methylthioadenosine/S-adenosylhomocysteine deaminase
MYFFPEAAAGIIRKAGIRAQLSFPIFDFPCAWGSGPDEYLRKGLALRDELKHSKLITVAFGPHAPYTVGDDAMQRVATLAAEADAAIQIHLHETQQEIDDAVAQTGKRPIQRLAELGLLGPKTQCVHLAALNDDDIATLANFGCHAVHCPESNMKLASGYSPVEKMRVAGINVAIGTDGAASNNDLDLFSEMRSAALLGKVVAGDASALPDHYALTMATLNGAKALGIDHLVGSLEVGKQADVIAIDLSALEQQPVYSPVSQLVYTNISHQVRYSWIMGRKVLDNGELTTLDRRDIIARAELWRSRISGE